MRLSCLLAASLLGAAAMAATGPEYGGYYTPERIANLRANCDKYPWARAQRDSAIAGAAFFVKFSDEDLWKLVPGQKLPRGIDVNMQNAVRTGGCPNCGPVIYETSKYPWGTDVWGHPWKIRCPRCNEWFPKNDFGKFYASALDERGCFDAKLGDRSLLFNTDHPDPNDPQHTWCVDDGWGWNPEPGKVNRFIGYYTWQYWIQIKHATAALARAYLYTGDPVYAHKCGVLLDRIADVYPEMDWALYGQQGWFHSGSTDGGKIEGSIWECETVSVLTTALDMVKSGLYNQPELYAFLAGKSGQYKLPTPKGTYEQLIGNIEQNLIAEFVKAVKTGRRIYGNEGGPQANVVECAVALNREPLSTEWLDWLFKVGTVGQGALKPGEGGHLPALIIGTMDRDGVGAEGAPSYSLGWGSALARASDLIADYGKYRNHSLFRDFPMFVRTLDAGWRMAVLGSYTPNIGDTGSCGGRHGIIAGDANFILRGYKYLDDPRYALLAGWAARGRTAGLGRDVCAADPEALEKAVAAQLARHGQEMPITGDNMAGYGLASVEFGPRDTGQALWMYYGLNGVAGHKSELMFGYDAFGFTVCPPLGYRELWGGWPKSVQWEDGQLSHNTVMVNEAQQSTIRVGNPEFYAQFADFGGFSVDAREVYPGVTKRYERTMALMQVGDGNASYALDIFRVSGGKDHLLSYHALPGPVTATNLKLQDQPTGSYAGPDIPFANSATGPRMGYSWLDHVQRDNQPPATFTLDVKGTPPYWNLKAEDDLHVRYHCFTQYTDVALADGYPPKGQAAGQPPVVRFLLARRQGETDLETTNVAVLEPYKGQPVIRQVRRLRVLNQAPGQEAVAVRVDLVDGATDYLCSGPDDETVYEVEGGLKFAGRLAAARLRDGRVEKAWLARAARLELGAFSLSLPSPAYRGTVARMDRDLKTHACLWTKTPLPTDGTLVGAAIIIANDRRQNACYTIAGIAKDGDLYKVDCGEVCFIRGFVDNTDYSKGYTYNFEPGAAWAIPQRARLARTGASVVQAEATAPLTVALPANSGR